MRNEAHRFGIAHHRNKRSKSAIRSGMEDIPGIGQKTIQLLLREFKSVKRLKEADPKAIAGIVGKAKAKIIMDALA